MVKVIEQHHHGTNEKEFSSLAAATEYYDQKMENSTWNYAIYDTLQEYLDSYSASLDDLEQHQKCDCYGTNSADMVFPVLVTERENGDVIHFQTYVDRAQIDEFIWEWAGHDLQTIDVEEI